MPGLPTHLVQELYVGTVALCRIGDTLYICMWFYTYHLNYYSYTYNGGRVTNVSVLELRITFQRCFYKYTSIYSTDIGFLQKETLSIHLLHLPSTVCIQHLHLHFTDLIPHVCNMNFTPTTTIRETTELDITESCLI